MISEELYNIIAKKYGGFASWAVWADAGEKPKSNIGDLGVFDLRKNPELLKQLNKEVIMVGLNFSRPISNELFVNFHDRRSQGQDYKIRYAFKGTPYYGAYMTDIIKDFEEKTSGNVISFLRKNPDFELMNIRLFQQELKDLCTENPLIIAFGNHVYDLLKKHFNDRYKIIKVPHYSNHIGQEDYRTEVEKILSAISK